jgi:glycosyltransferase involved in cell wall biosynthesis
MALANRLVTRPMMRAADELVFISDTVREDLLGRTAWRDYRLIFNGVDTAVFHPASVGEDAPGVHFAWPPGKKRILFVGRYVEKKGLTVIRALAEFRPDLSFLLAGSGVLQPSEWGLANVHDLGPRPQGELAELYRSANLLLLPSVGEGYPLVIQEAMACGLPVVCGRPSDRADPNAARWLRGVEIDLGDPQGSASRCNSAIEAAGLSETEREEMADYAAATYLWGAMAGTMIACARGHDGES